MSSRGDAMDTDVVERRRKKQRPAKAPAVLRGAYARVVSLERATRDACRDARPPIAPPALRRPGDDATYLDFLRWTFVAAPEPLPRDADTTAACGMDEVIVRALGYHFKTHPSPSNVLCNGAQRKDPRRPGGGANNRPADWSARRSSRERETREPTRADAPRECRRPLVAPDVDIVHESAAIENLRGDTWRTYVERAGDQLAFHLLTKASVFVVVNQGGADRSFGAAGYLQLCGKPVSVAARARQMADARAAKKSRKGATKAREDDVGKKDAADPSERNPTRKTATIAREREVRALFFGDPGSRPPRGRRGGSRAETDRDPRVGKRDCGGEEKEKRGGGGAETREAREAREDRGDSAPRLTPPLAQRNVFVSGSEALPLTSAAPSSAAATLLRRASGFVRGVITANPFMRAKPATTARDSPPRETYAAVPAPGADGGVRFSRADDDGSEATEEPPIDGAVSGYAGVVSESAVVTEERAPNVPQCATAECATRRRPPRPSSWLRRRAAKARAALAAEVSAGATDKVGDAHVPSLVSPSGADVALPSANANGEDSTEIVPETPDASHDSGHGSFLPSARFPRRRAEPSTRLGALPSANAGHDADSDADSGAGWERLGAAADEEPMECVGDPSDDRSECARAAENARRAADEKRARLKRARLEASGGAAESKPGSVSFDASAFAHKTSFARRPGLPRGHILNVCGFGPRAARRLYAHVFAGPETPSRSSAPKKNGSNAATDVFPDGFSVPRARKKPTDARRVPRRDRESMLPLLQLMLHRARRCPYGALLDAHCPMPAGVARRLGGGRDAARPADAFDRFFNRLDETRGGAETARETTARETTVTTVDLTREEEDEELPDDADALDFGEEVSFSTEAGEDAASDDAGCRETKRKMPRDANDAESDPPSLLASFVPPRAVASFLWAVIRRVAPRETLGGRRSRASLRNFLLRLTSLRRSERCTLHEAMRGARTSEFPWLFGKRLGTRAFEDDESVSSSSRRGNKSGRTGPVTSYLARRRRLRRWFRFLIDEVAVPLLRAHFYCTETEANRNRMFFYRKGVWARLTAAHLAATTEDEAGETKTPLPKRLASAPVDPAAAATTNRKPYARLKKPSARYALQRHLLGFSRLRLLPKHSGLRPVAMLGRPAVASFAPPGGRNGKSLGLEERQRGDTERQRGDKKRPGRVSLAFRPVNAGLQSVFDVLRFESKRRPEVMGANVSDYHDVRARLVPFIRRWRARQRRLALERSWEARTEPRELNGDETKTKTKRAPANGGVVAGPAPVVERPFIVAADVKGAFDSIPLEALERVAAALVEAPAYDVQRLTRVTGGAGGVGVRAKTARHATRAFSREEDANAYSDNSKVSSGGVCIDLASPTRVHRARVLELLHEHLRKNVVRSGGVYLLQKVGIPQGSVLSTLLCGVFYAHLESAHGLRDGGGVRSNRDSSVVVSNEQETDGVLCRWTDDLLYVSTARAPAERFLKAATRGFEEHGCVMNAGKTSTNFDGRGEQVSGSRKCVAWCGLLIDSETLECTVDYARYAGDRAREAVTTPGFAGGGGGVGDPYKHLGRKICAYLRPKAIPLLYDRSVNSPLTAKLNVYQNFLMAAVKTHCYVAATTPRRPGRRSDEATGKNAKKNNGPGPGPSAARVCAALAEGIAYMERATCSRASGKGKKARRRARAVARTHVRFLGLSAFLVTFSRKKTRHAGTVAALRAALATPEMRACARRLAPVLEDPRNDVFGEIRF